MYLFSFVSFCIFHGFYKNVNVEKSLYFSHKELNYLVLIEIYLMFTCFYCNKKVKMQICMSIIKCGFIS